MAPGETLWHRYLWLTPRRLGLIAAAWVLAVIAHNLVYGLVRGLFADGWDEPVFFILATLVIPAYVVVAAVYSVAVRLRSPGG
ncbi:MAG: hypothetical protein IT299_09195 [Dehalococcoidia bacterium]|nr:hypothetical protein [Dehalococcoidia bacterium]